MCAMEDWGVFSQLKDIKFGQETCLRSQGPYFRNLGLGLQESKFLSLLKKIVISLRSKSSTLSPED